LGVAITDNTFGTVNQSINKNLYSASYKAWTKAFNFVKNAQKKEKD